MSQPESNQTPSMAFYTVVWALLIVIVGVEVLLTFRHFPSRELLAYLLILAFVEAGIGVMYFMHLKYERSILFWSVIPVLLFVFFMMDHIWPDALRIEHLRVVHW
jgi:cytochrome c oxidase subunit IV